MRKRTLREKNEPSLLSLHLNVIFADASPTKNSFCCCCCCCAFFTVVVEDSSSKSDDFTSTSARKYASPIQPGRKSDILVGWMSVVVEDSCRDDAVISFLDKRCDRGLARPTPPRAILIDYEKNFPHWAFQEKKNILGFQFIFLRSSHFFLLFVDRNVVTNSTKIYLKRWR